jgi:hypothetical protein
MLTFVRRIHLFGAYILAMPAVKRSLDFYGLIVPFSCPLRQTRNNKHSESIASNTKSLTDCKIQSKIVQAEQNKCLFVAIETAKPVEGTTNFLSPRTITS